MAKYIKRNGGTLNEAEAVVASAGAADKDKLVATDATGKLDASLMPVGVGVDSLVAIASEALTAGDLVNIYDDAGVATCRKACAAVPPNSFPAMGFVKADVALAGNAEIFFEGTNGAVTGQVSGVAYLSVTPGKSTSVVPSLPGQIAQVIGFAVGATALNFDAGMAIILA